LQANQASRRRRDHGATLQYAKAEPRQGAVTDCGARNRRMAELEALLEAGNTRAPDHLPWL
jgi:hypothetical protein